MPSAMTVCEEPGDESDEQGRDAVGQDGRALEAEVEGQDVVQVQGEECLEPDEVEGADGRNEAEEGMGFEVCPREGNH